MRNKSQVFSCFKRFHKMVHTQFDAKVQILKNDNSTECMDGLFQSYLAERGIIHQTSCMNIPNQSGVTEHKNRHLLEVVRSLMFKMNVPKAY